MGENYKQEDPVWGLRDFLEEVMLKVNPSGWPGVNQVESMWQSEGRGQPLEDTQVQGRWAKAGPACRSAPQKTVRRAPAASAEHSARCICGAQGPWLRE